MRKAIGFISVLWILSLGACGGVPTLRPVEQFVTPMPADGFDFPLDPDHYGPYVRGVSGLYNVDTRFGVQNPALGDEGKCFRDQDGRGVPFRELYHAGEDWFHLDAAGQVDATAAGDSVRAVAHGVVDLTQEIGGQGWVVVLAHRLADGTPVYSAYWHVSQLRVRRGEAVRRGQVIAQIHDQGANSHLHWEIRTFADGTAIFPGDSAGGRGTCNGRPPGVGYTWDDDPARAHPESWGYLDPVAFVESLRP